MTYQNEGAASFRERTIARIEKFIDTKVPYHTRDEYRALLATNTDLAIKLITKWQELEDLRAAYYALQEEASRGIPLPPVVPSFAVDYNPMRMEEQYQIAFHMDPYRMRFVMMGDPRVRFEQQREVARAFHDTFHRKFVPTLWERTVETLHMPATHTPLERYFT